MRPTSARVREALFSMVGQRLDGQRVLDAFGGSGLLGFEAWSRGADVVISELRPATARAIRESAKALGAQVEVVVGDTLRQPSPWGRVDGVLADPPYAMVPDMVLPTLAALAPRWLAYETAAGRVAPATVGPMRLRRDRLFGSTALWIYDRGEDDVDEPT